MKHATSINLDLLRWLAALGVFVCHFSQLGVGDQRASVLEPVGRLGVVIFFLMSGFVIASVCDSKHSRLGSYLQARFARLYSVFIPALVLTLALDALGRTLSPRLYAGYPSPFDARFIAYWPFFVTFMYENALFGLRWLSNGPMWSIAYEFWYYVIFGLVIYLGGARRIVYVALALVLAGWKILLLAPVWLAGVAIYRHRDLIGPRLSPLRGPLLALAMAALIGLCTPWAYEKSMAIRWLGVSAVGRGWHEFFLLDFIYAIPGGLLLAVLGTTGIASVAARVEWLVRDLASSSFSLYLFHVPLILAARSARLYNPNSLPQCVMAALAILLTIRALARVTEHKKHVWHALIGKVTLLARGRLLDGKSHGY
jgi:peptidoglycan/LPS O-acetylase OafA/YrhL